MAGIKMGIIFKNKYSVFWEALLIAVFIFAAGILLGVTLENKRSNQIDELYLEAELQTLDLKIQSEIFGLQGFDCEKAAAENIRFGDKIFEEAILLRELEESQTLTNSLERQHRKYDLLRTLFWINSIKIKQRCESTFHNVVYIYNYRSGVNEKALQSAFSKYLSELKNKYGGQVILIPIAGDLNLFSTQSLINEYDIEKLPVIIVDETEKFYAIEDLDKIEELII